MPDLELPIAPSWYMSNTGRPWELREDNTWYFNGVPMTKREAHRAAPFKRLDTRVVTANEALDQVAEAAHNEDRDVRDGVIDEVVDSIRPRFDELFHE